MSNKALLEKIACSVSSCQKCRLYRTRTCAVPGTGSFDARVLFVGQCPGYHEDQEGLPFVGRAGSLLDDLFNSVRIARGATFITNIVKCRPPENRDPMVDEVRSCRPYLEGQIEFINPQLIVTLGRFATEHFIREGSISTLHGKPTAVRGRIVFPLYHPAAALRSSGVRNELERDFSLIPDLLERDVAEFESSGVQGEVDNQLGLL